MRSFILLCTGVGLAEACVEPRSQADILMQQSPLWLNSILVVNDYEVEMRTIRGTNRRGFPWSIICID